jgi:hypothetical protein
MKLLLPVFLFFFFAATAQKNYKEIQNSDLYISAAATSNSDEEAQSLARNMLIKQISSIVSSSSTMTITAGNNTSEQKFDNVSKSNSTLRLVGLKFVKIPTPKDEKGLTYLAYISKEDLRISSEAAAKEVRSHLELMEQQQSIGINYFSSVYSAYLSTYFTPYPVGYKFGTDSISNVQNHLERMLTDHLTKIQINCTLVEEHPFYPKDQLRFHLKLEGASDESMQYSFSCPAYNALAEMGLDGGTFDVMMRPNATTELMKGTLSMKAIGLNEKLKDLAKSLPVEQEKEFNADMSNIIQYDFEIKEEEKYIQLIPTIKNISINAFEWSSNGKVLNTDQLAKISKDVLGPNITLKLNNNEALQKTKPLVFKIAVAQPEKKPEVIIPKEEVVSKVDPIETPKEPTKSLYTKESHGFNELKNFAQLEKVLLELKNSGKGNYGKKSIFLKPSKCWIFMVEPTSKEIIHVLSPDENGRFNLKDNKTYSDFESTFKGFISIWVEVY